MTDSAPKRGVDETEAETVKRRLIDAVRERHTRVVLAVARLLRVVTRPR